MLILEAVARRIKRNDECLHKVLWQINKQMHFYFQCVDWSVLFRRPHLGYIHVLWNRGAQMKNFVWLRRVMCEQKPPGSSDSFGPAPHVTTLLWPSSLLTSRSVFSHQHNDPLLMASQPLLIQLLPPYLIKTQTKAIGQSLFIDVFLLELFKINHSVAEIQWNV